jgi:tetratricopeptide (TPR) repeat protein
MKITFIRTIVCGGLLISALTMPQAALAQDILTTARDLYASAAYEDALAVLSRLDPNLRPSDRLAANQVRSFCLVALRRNAEAEEAIEAVLADEPSYNPSAVDSSPRLLSVFTSVRQRILPTIAQRKYAHAKAAFDNKEFATAAVEFEQVLRVLDDADLAEAVRRPPLSDIRTLAFGFRDLSARASAPPPAAPPVEAPVAAQPVHAVAVALRIYNSGELNVQPPDILRQDLPPLPREVIFHGQGVLEVVINEFGQVESAVMRTAIDPRYDRLVLAATRQWRYVPANVGGTPVKFRKIIGVRTKVGP